MGLKQIRKAIADYVQEAKPEWNIYGTVPPVPVYPACAVVPANDTFVEFNQTMGGQRTWIMDLKVMVAYSEMETSQDYLDDEVSPDNPKSIVYLIKRNPTLNDTVSDCTVVRGTHYARAEAGEAGGATLMGVDIRLEVMEC